MGILDWLWGKKKKVESEKERTIQEKERVVQGIERASDERKEFSILWKYRTGGIVDSVAISSDKKYIVIGCRDNRVYLLNKEGELLWEYETGDWVYSVAITPDGEYIAAGSGSSVYLFNKEGKLLWKYETGGSVDSVAITPDGEYITAGSYDNNVYLFNGEGKLLWKYRTGGIVKSVSITSDGKYVVVGSGDNRVYLLNKEGKLLWKYETGDWVYSVAITPDGEYIVAGSGYSVYLFNGEGKLLWKYETGGSVDSVAITPDGEYITAGSWDKNVYLFNRKGKLLWKYETGGSVYSVSISSDGKCIAAGSGYSVYLFAPLQVSLQVTPKIIKDARLTISQIKSKYNVEEAESILLQAEQAFNKGEYLKAKELALKAKEKAIEIKERAQSVKWIIKDARSTISQIKSKYNVSEAESLLSQAEEAFSKEEYLKAKELALKAKEKAIEIEMRAGEVMAKIEELEPWVGLVSGLSELLENAKKEFRERNYENVPLHINKCKELIERAKPELRIKLLNSSFTLNAWKKVEMDVINEGNAIAKDIVFEFSDDVIVRNLPEIEVEPKGRRRVEFYLRPNVLGEVPLEVKVRCKDHLDREHEFRETIMLEVKERVGEVTPERGISPAEFTPKPTTPKTFPPELSERYVRVEYIGKGGFARVFKARRRDGREVAVKIPLSLDEATGKSFIRELTNWTKLNHENIVKVYDYNILPIPYFEMELCDHSLADLPKPVEIEKAAWLVFNIAEGLKYAHSKGIIHRDLKPQNILLKDGVPKISDWGLSKVMAESSSTIASFTPLYASPEQVKGESKDERTDIWQLGVIFYELVTGELPFKGDSFVEIGMAIVTKQPVKPSEINPEAKEVEGIILKCLEKDKEKRYQSVKELQRDLAEYLGMKYRESLKLSVSRKDFRRSAYYCCELLLINMKINNLVSAYNYASDLLSYADGEVKREVQELCEQLKVRMEYGMRDVPEELIKKAEIIAHRIRLGFNGK